MDMKNNRQNLAVFDIGGTAVKYGLWDGARLLHNASFKTPQSFEMLTAKMGSIIKDYPQLKGIAISSPGAVNTKKEELTESVLYPICMIVRYLMKLNNALTCPWLSKMMPIVQGFVKLIMVQEKKPRMLFF
jgi:hypothetical protein